MSADRNGLPKICSLTNVDLQQTIFNVRSVLLAKQRPQGYRKLKRSAWEREKAQMRFQLGLYAELLDLRRLVAKARARKKVQPLGEPSNGFDSDLLTPEEIALLGSDGMFTGNEIATLDPQMKAHYAVLPLLTTICEERRSRA